MGKFMFGLLTGIVVCALAGFLMMPGIQKKSYDGGYAEGVKKGAADGMTAGVAKGIEQVKSELMAKRAQDSVAAAQRYLLAKQKAAAARRKIEAKPKPIQNWHVIDGKIDEPIPSN